MIVDDVKMIRMAMFYIYYDTRKIKRKITRKGGEKDRTKRRTDKL